MITAVAIDDEPIALDVVASHASKVPFLKLKAVFTNAFEAIEYLDQHPVELIFVDIKMPDISGIDLVRSLKKKPMVVFTTAYAGHAVTGFELDAIDYLLKPFSLARFLKACNKVQELLDMQKEIGLNNDFIFLKTGYEQVKVIFDEIVYLEAKGNYVNFVLDGNQVLSRLTIAECESLLPSRLFLRIHRSFIVAKGKIERIERHQLRANGYILPVSTNYKEAVEELNKGQ